MNESIHGYFELENITKSLYNSLKRNEKKVNDITLQQKIKVACDMAGMSLTELGAKMGMSQASISKRVKTGKFTQEELEQMASILGAEYKAGFYFPDGNKVD